jgi:hypothetical protein
LLLAIAAITALYATGHQPNDITGGFSDTQLAPSVFRISFAGNSFTSQDRVQDSALPRAAELCLSNGFPYLEVLISAMRFWVF